MITHESYVSLETARLLKQAGFDWEVDVRYKKGEWSPNELSLYRGDLYNYNYYKAEYSAPTLAVAQRWLREVKHEFIGVHPVVNKWFYSILRPNFGHYYKNKQFNAYEEAQESGIKKALELILEKEE